MCVIPESPNVLFFIIILFYKNLYMALLCVWNVHKSLISVSSLNLCNSSTR